MTDTVFISGLRIDTIIGVYDWERRVRQQLVFDLEMDWDITRPGATDAVADTLDYAAVANRLEDFVSTSRFELLEALAEAVCALVIEEFRVPRVRLRLSKPGAVPAARAVGVQIERGEPR